MCYKNFDETEGFRHTLRIETNPAYLTTLRDLLEPMWEVAEQVNFISGDVAFDVTEPLDKVLTALLDAAVSQKVLVIEYTAKATESAEKRKIQPVCIYANNGYWYCKAYCFLRGGFRVFRCDRIREAAYDDSGTERIDLGDISLSRREVQEPRDPVRLRALFTRSGVQRCESELWLAPMLLVHEDGSGSLDMDISRDEISFYADFFIGLGFGAALK